MRAGDDSDPNTYWRSTFRGDERTRLDTRGRPLTLRSYNRLERAQQAGITPDTENWEGWSAAYDLALGKCAECRGRSLGSSCSSGPISTPR